MARHGRTRNRTGQKRSERRRRSKEATLRPVPNPVEVAKPLPIEPSAPAESRLPVHDLLGERREYVHPRRRPTWVLVPLAALFVLAVALSGAWIDRPVSGREPTPASSIVVGEIGGMVATPPGTPDTKPDASPTAEPTAVPTPVPTPLPTAAPTTAVATPAPTALPATPAPTTPAPATPDPTTVVAVASNPAESVATFYSRAAAGEFDAAYALWSDRMKADFSREENLDGRFDETSAITFTQLQTVGQRGDRAVVQANFIEEYESGATREFIGYWEVVLVDGAWVLDQPHY